MVDPEILGASSTASNVIKENIMGVFNNTPLLTYFLVIGSLILTVYLLNRLAKWMFS
jgi:hypothetical protein